MKKVAIIGAGNVGAHVASAVISRDIACEILMVDPNEAFEAGQVLDLRDSMLFSPRTRVSGASFKDATVHDADIFVITAGAPRQTGDSRLDLLEKNMRVLDSVRESLGEIRKDAVIIVVTNPVDIATQYVADTFGLPHGQVFGTGTVLDTARLRWRLAEKLDRNIANAHGHVLGEHGDSCVIPWSLVSSCDKFSLEEKAQLHEDVKKGGAQIIAGKGATYFGIGSTTAELIDAVLSNSRRLYPVTVPLRGEYGVEGISIGVPCPVGETGVEKIVEMSLEKEELEALQKSAGILKEMYDKLPK